MRSNFVFWILLISISIGLPIETENVAASYARYFVSNGTRGVFATQSASSPAFPYSSCADFSESCELDGNLVFLLANNSETSINLKKYGYGSFTIWSDNCTIHDYNHMPYDPLACPRFTIMGEFFQNPYPVSKNDTEFIKFAQSHPAAYDWIKYPGHTFYLWEMWFYEIHYTGGYGNLHYIGPIDLCTYFEAHPINPYQ